MTDRSRRVPSARLARLAAFGQIAGGVATGVLGEGLRRLARGERPHLPDLLLTPANARTVTARLEASRDGGFDFADRRCACCNARSCRPGTR